MASVLRQSRGEARYPRDGRSDPPREDLGCTHRTLGVDRSLAADDRFRSQPGSGVEIQEREVSEKDSEMDVELGELVEVAPAKSQASVVAVRVAPDLLARITEYAGARGLSVSEVLRRGAEQLTSGLAGVGAVYYTGSELRGPGLVHGSPATGSARTKQQASEKDEENALTAPG